MMAAFRDTTALQFGSTMSGALGADQRKIPSLSKWHRCDAFREASDADSDGEKVDHILLKFFSLRAGLPYTLATLNLAKKCEFAPQRLESIDISRIVDSYLKLIHTEDEVAARKAVAQIMQVGALDLEVDLSNVTDEIIRNIKEKRPQEEIRKFIMQEAQTRADRAVERLIDEKGSVKPLTRPISDYYLIPVVFIILTGLTLILVYSRNN